MSKPFKCRIKYNAAASSKRYVVVVKEFIVDDMNVTVINDEDSMFELYRDNKTIFAIPYWRFISSESLGFVGPSATVTKMGSL